MDLDDLPSHTTMKVKATLPEEISTTTPIDPQPDPAQINKHTNEQNKDIVMDGSDTLEQERQALLADESIFFDFKHTMDTDAASNATIEGTKVPTDYTAPTRVANKSIDLREEELDATKWNYNTILQAFSTAKTKRAKPQLPKDKETLLENIKMIDEAPQIPITEYSIINSTLEWLHKKYEYNRIPAYLLELLNQLSAMAVRNSVQPYIQNVQSIPAILVMINLALPRKTRIRVISIYLLSNNQKLSLKAQHEIIEWIMTTQKKNYQLIVMGDFNNNLHNKE
ncbi:14720_t:CDS:2, partial [Gigaspora margarita]